MSNNASYSSLLKTRSSHKYNNFEETPLSTPNENIILIVIEKVKTVAKLHLAFNTK